MKRLNKNLKRDIVDDLADHAFANQINKATRLYHEACEALYCDVMGNYIQKIDDLPKSFFGAGCFFRVAVHQDHVGAPLLADEFKGPTNKYYIERFQLASSRSMPKSQFYGETLAFASTKYQFYIKALNKRVDLENAREEKISFGKKLRLMVEPYSSLKKLLEDVPEIGKIMPSLLEDKQQNSLIPAQEINDIRKLLKSAEQ